MREADLQDEIRLALGQVPGLAVWRNNVGVGSVGRAQTRVRYGLSVGSADLIGVVRMDSGIGRFIALEVKTAAGSVSPAQRQWLQLVGALGGYAAIVRSVEGALDAVEAARRGET